MTVLTHFEIHCGRDISEALYRLDSEFFVPVRKYREDHIFDEDKSVKWNREEVVRQNQEQKVLREQASLMRQESNEYFYEELYRYIMEEAIYDYRFTKAQAEVIWNETCKHHEQEPWNWVDTMAETAASFYAVSEVKK